MLKVEGEEDVYFPYIYYIYVNVRRTRRVKRGNSWRTERYTARERRQKIGWKSGEHEFFKQKFPLYNGYLQPGQQFEIPFSFLLSADLPTSFKYKWHEHGRKCHAITDFEIKVEMKGSKLEEKVPFIVNQPLTGYVQEGFKNLSKEMTCYCCCSRGKVQVATKFEKDKYQPGETARMITSIDNSDSKDQINTLQARFA